MKISTASCAANNNQQIRISHASLLLLLAILGVLAYLACSIMLDSAGSRISDVAVLITFGINTIIGLAGLAQSVASRAFSMTQMHWLFYLTMFVAAPFSQYLYGYVVWTYPLSNSDYLLTNVALMAWGIAVFLIANTGTESADRRVTQYIDYFNSLPLVSARSSVLATIVSVLVTVLAVAVVGWGNLFSISDFSTGLDKTSSLIFGQVIRPLPVFAYVVCLTRVRQTGVLNVLPFINLAMMLVSNFPAAMPRYSMACLYGGILLLSSKTLFEKKGLFPLLFLLAFLVVLPAANSYRYDSFDFSVLLNSALDAACNLPKGFCAVDYDAYSMVARSLRFVSENGALWGAQLLGVVLFFVPRSIWPAKPEGTGNLVCSSQGQTVLNISAPLPSEGLVNFDIAGLVLFAIVFALVCRLIDKQATVSSCPAAFRLFYPFLVLMVFFIMRGDLLSSWAYTVGYCLSLVILISIVGIRSDAKNRRQRACSSNERCKKFSEYIAENNSEISSKEKNHRYGTSC